MSDEVLRLRGVEVLGERLGEVDIFDLRPRIGLTSAAIAEQVPPAEKVIDLVLTASYAILGRWKEEYDSADVTRAVEILDALGCAHLIRRRFSTLSEGERKRVQIARALTVSEKTVKAHVSAVLAKLGVQDRTQAALIAVRHEQG